MSISQRPAECSFPPAPWFFQGHLWVGFFRTRSPTCLPLGLRHFLNPRCLVVMVVRYLGGTRRYDELVVGSLARRGLRVGLFVEGIWVADAVGLWAGRRIWGFPKEMADFRWTGDTVSIADAAGPIANITVDRRDARWPPVFLTAPSFGQREGRLTYTVSRLWASLGRARMRIEQWSERFPHRLAAEPIFSVAAKGFRLTLPAPKIL